MNLNTIFITAVCDIFLAKSDARFRTSQYLYYYASGQIIAINEKRQRPDVNFLLLTPDNSNAR